MPGVLEIDFTKVKRKIRSAPGSAKTSPTLTRKGTVAEISSNCFDIYKYFFQNATSKTVTVNPNTLNRSSRRKRGMTSNPLFIIPDFFCIFPMNFAMATLGLKEMGKFL